MANQRKIHKKKGDACDSCGGSLFLKESKSKNKVMNKFKYTHILLCGNVGCNKKYNSEAHKIYPKDVKKEKPRARLNGVKSESHIFTNEQRIHLLEGRVSKLIQLWNASEEKVRLLERRVSINEFNQIERI